MQRPQSHSSAFAEGLREDAVSCAFNSMSLASEGSAELAYQYWSSCCLNYDDELTDGFYDVRGEFPEATSSPDDFPSLAALSRIAPSTEGTSRREVVLYDRRIDPTLQTIESEAREALRAVSCMPSRDSLACHRALCHVVASRLGGPQRSPSNAAALSAPLVADAALRSGCVVVLIGDLYVGSSRHRATLYKFLADLFGMKARVIKGRFYADSDDDARVIVDVSGQEHEVDLLVRPGAVTSLQASLALRASSHDVGSMSSRSLGRAGSLEAAAAARRRSVGDTPAPQAKVPPPPPPPVTPAVPAAPTLEQALQMAAAAALGAPPPVAGHSVSFADAHDPPSSRGGQFSFSGAHGEEEHHFLPPEGDPYAAASNSRASSALGSPVLRSARPGAPYLGGELSLETRLSLGRAAADLMEVSGPPAIISDAATGQHYLVQPVRASLGDMGSLTMSRASLDYGAAGAAPSSDYSGGGVGGHTYNSSALPPWGGAFRPHQDPHGSLTAAEVLREWDTSEGTLSPARSLHSRQLSVDPSNVGHRPSTGPSSRLDPPPDSTEPPTVHGWAEHPSPVRSSASQQQQQQQQQIDMMQWAAMRAAGAGPAGGEPSAEGNAAERGHQQEQHAGGLPPWPHHQYQQQQQQQHHWWQAEGELPPRPRMSLDQSRQPSEDHRFLNSLSSSYSHSIDVNRLYLDGLHRSSRQMGGDVTPSSVAVRMSVPVEWEQRQALLSRGRTDGGRSEGRNSPPQGTLKPESRSSGGGIVPIPPSHLPTPEDLAGGVMFSPFHAAAEEPLTNSTSSALSPAPSHEASNGTGSGEAPSQQQLHQFQQLSGQMMDGGLSPARNNPRASSPLGLQGGGRRLSGTNSAALSVGSADSKATTTIGGISVAEVVDDEWEIPDEALEFGPRIGIGSFGEVYRGQWRQTDVAIKHFLDQDLGVRVIENFRKEVAIMKRLRHPNIVQFIGACTKPSHLCIVTQYVSRGSLFKLLHRGPTPSLDERRRLQMALDVARGMNYLHTCRPPVIHRDLKSPNLLVDKDLTIKVCDFGLSRVRHATVLSAKSQAGTPEWTAPEVLCGGPCNEASDVYSFGVILWELITGEEPWGDRSAMQVVGAVGFSGERLQVPEGTRPALANLIQRCFGPPDNRPSFSEMIPILKRQVVLLGNASPGSQRRPADQKGLSLSSSQVAENT